MFKKVVITLFVLFCGQVFAANIAEVSQDQLIAKQTNKEDMLVLDVRTPNEFKAGHVPGAMNISFNEIPANMDKLYSYKDKEVVVYCRSGSRAKVGISTLDQLGFTHISHLSGDMNAWLANMRPIAN